MTDERIAELRIHFKAWPDILQLLDALKAAQRDSEILDWLESLRAPLISQFGDGQWWQIYIGDARYTGAFLRAAARAAMKGKPEPILGGIFDHAFGCKAGDYGPCSCGADVKAAMKEGK